MWAMLFTNRPVIGDHLQQDSLQSLMEAAVRCDCCCNCTPDLHLPIYKVLQGFLISYGGVSGCSPCGDFDNYTQQLQLRVVGENAELTQLFYNQVLNSLFFVSITNFISNIVSNFHMLNHQGIPLFFI